MSGSPNKSGRKSSKEANEARIWNFIDRIKKNNYTKYGKNTAHSLIFKDELGLDLGHVSNEQLYKTDRLNIVQAFLYDYFPEEFVKPSNFVNYADPLNVSRSKSFNIPKNIAGPSTPVKLNDGAGPSKSEELIDLSKEKSLSTQSQNSAIVEHNSSEAQTAANKLVFDQNIQTESTKPIGDARTYSIGLNGITINEPVENKILGANNDILNIQRESAAGKAYERIQDNAKNEVINEIVQNEMPIIKNNDKINKAVKNDTIERIIVKPDPATLQELVQTEGQRRYLEYIKQMQKITFW